MRCGRKEEREEERMKEKEKEKKKRGRERRIENRESGTRSVPPSQHDSHKEETREKHNSHKQNSNKTEPESSGGSPAKTIKLRRFISRRFQLHIRRSRISEV